MHNLTRPVFAGSEIGVPQTYDDISVYFERNQCWGLQASVDISQCNPILIRQKETIQKYVCELCELIDMKRYGNTIIEHFGEEERVAGFSMVQLIQTSLVSGHFANATNNAYIDIFSCKIFDPYKAGEYSKKFFEGANVKVAFGFR